MRILVATDKFKGSLIAREVAARIGKAINSVDSNIEIDLLPIADGGEGTAGILADRLGATRRITQTVDPLGPPIEAESCCERGPYNHWRGEALRAPNAALLKKVMKLMGSPHRDALNRPLRDRSAGKPEQPVD
jgi:hypothetical protein